MTYTQFRFALTTIAVSWMAFFFSCATKPPEWEPPFFFADHVYSSPATFNRADLPALRDDAILSARVTLRDETRLSLVPPLTGRLSFALEIPSQPILRFAIATATLAKPRFRSPVEFTLILQSDGHPETLFQERVSRPQRNRWLDREVDLGSWVGTNARLTFEARIVDTEERNASDPQELFPLWGSPVLSSGVEHPNNEKLILISVDCLRADHVGAYGYSRATTPRIDELAADGVVYETAISTSSTTLPTHTSMFTGLTPSVHGATNERKLSPSVPYLPEILARAGYQVDGIVSGAYVSQYFGFERGFHSYISRHRPRASESVDRTLEVLERARGQSQFVFMHLIDAHWPYDPPAEIKERFRPVTLDIPPLMDKVLKHVPPRGEEELEQVKALYDAEVAYADQEIGRLVHELKAKGLYSRSLIILTADHGESFFEHGRWQHGLNLFDEILRVPLIVKWPGNVLKGRAPMQVSQAEIFSTLLEQAGIDSPHSKSTSLKRYAVEDEQMSLPTVAVSEYVTNSVAGSVPVKRISLRTEKQKYVVAFEIEADDEFTVAEILHEEIYDLVRDPGETRNLLDEPALDTSLHRQQLYAYLQEAREYQQGRQGEAVVPDETILERLKALGYVISQ